MKILKSSLWLLICLVSCKSLLAQDSLTYEVLKPLTYSFQIKDGVLSGPGASFLGAEIRKAQYTMLGEYHGSKRISELTEALIPVMDSAGYKTMVLEVGPASAKLLNDAIKQPEQTTQVLHQLNDKYALVEEDGYVNTPIPFFSNIEDAAFLTRAKERDWNVLGIDQEFIYGFAMLLDEMYKNLSAASQSKHKQIYEAASDSMKIYYQDDFKDKRRFAKAVTASTTIDEFLTKMSSTASNLPIIDAFKKSLHIYHLYATRQWFENNSTRIKYMKAMLHKGLTDSAFDLQKDKLFIKMGGIHLARGFSNLSLYEVGNTLSELAAYYGNSTLNISFGSRFYMENDTLVDELQSTSRYAKRYKDLNQMGKADEWVVIDLRPLIKGYYYRPRKYLFNKWIAENVQQYDLLIIPKTEMDPTPNYSSQ